MKKFYKIKFEAHSHMFEYLIYSELKIRSGANLKLYLFQESMGILEWICSVYCLF